MLAEVRGIEQHDGGATRRWFSDSEHDLFVWQRDGEICRFEWCFGKGSDQRALSWTCEEGVRHFRVDDGEDRQMRHKMTPLLEADGLEDFDAVRDEFCTAAVGLDSAIVAFVVRCLSHAGPGPTA